MMKKRSEKKTIAILREYFKWWINWTGLGWWRVDILFIKDRKEFTVDKNREQTMVCIADWRYLTATIRVNLQSARERKRYDLERTVVHELVHILVNELDVGDTGHNERTVTQLTKAFFWVRDQAKEEASK